jgi:hypothetical protein
VEVEELGLLVVRPFTIRSRFPVEQGVPSGESRILTYVVGQARGGSDHTLSDGLTAAEARHTIRGMQRDTLLTILQCTPAVRLDGDRFQVNDDHDFTVYLGQPGRATAIDHVLSLALAESHLEVEARDRGTFYVTYEVVHALLDGRRKERRGTTSGVGF